jgi:hypothetical protein
VCIASNPSVAEAVSDVNHEMAPARVEGPPGQTGERQPAEPALTIFRGGPGLMNHQQPPAPASGAVVQSTNRLRPDQPGWVLTSEQCQVFHLLARALARFMENRHQIRPV